MRGSYEVRRGELLISDDADRVDIELVHRFLSQEAYWSKGIDRLRTERALTNSLCFGVYRESSQVAFARVVSDRATFAYLCDVFVLPNERGRGIGKWLCETALAHPDLAGLRRILLATADAHGLYGQMGFRPLGKPERFMERYVPARELYARGGT